METLKRFWNSVKSMWERMSGPYRVALASLVSLLVFSLVWGLTAATSSGWVRLVGDEDRDAELRVKKKLEELNVPEVQYRDDGIYVPRERRGALILEVADVLGDDELYRFLREADLTASQWQLQQSMLVATQKKIEGMIKIDSVAKVTVKITPASTANRLNFSGPPATAAVTIKLRPGRDFTKENTLAVAKVVAASVEGLKPEDVKILDTAGRLYEIPPAGSAWRVAMDRLDAEQQYIKLAEESVRKLYPSARVAPFYELNAESMKKHERKFGEDPREVETAKKELSLTSGSRAGDPGLKGESREVYSAGPGVGTAESRDESETRKKSKFDETMVETELPAGGKKVAASIAVIIPVPGADEKVLQQKDTEIPKLTQMIAKGTGIDAANISIGFISEVVPVDLPGPTAWEEGKDFLREWGGTIFLWLLALTAIFVLYSVLKRAMPRDVMGEIEEMRRRMEAEAGTPAVAGEVAVGEQELSRMKTTIRDMVSKNPRGVANVLRRWITGK